MGTPLPPNPPGNICANCWGPGEVFGNVATPKYVTVTLSGLKAGEFWVPADETLLLTPHVLIQSMFPCTFEVRDETFQWHLVWDPARTSASVIRIVDNESAFQQGNGDVCVQSLGNFSDEFDGVISFDGSMDIVFGGIPL